jgi:serine/threonine-protein kinase
MIESETLPSGTMLGRYRIKGLVGTGAMGTVYEATHHELEKRVAVKVLRANSHTDQSARARFVQEGKAIAKIQHPNVVEVFDVGQHEGHLYLVMEYLEGRSLGATLAEHKRLPLARAVDLLLPVCAGVACAHDAGVVHRDLKPDNIFIAKARHGASQPRVLDFGISKVEGRGARPLTEHTSIGTPEYMPPEQIRSDPNVDGRADQYALAVVLYECLTGARPYESADLQHLIVAIRKGHFSPVSAIVPELPKDLDVVIARALAVEPTKRYATMNDFALALLPFASELARATWGPIFERFGEATPSLISLPPRATLPENVYQRVAPHAPTEVFQEPAASSMSTTHRWPRIALAVAATAMLISLSFLAGLTQRSATASPAHRAPQLQAALVLPPAAPASAPAAPLVHVPHVVSPAPASTALVPVEVPTPTTVPRRRHRSHQHHTHADALFGH